MENESEKLLEELEQIRDIYKVDVRQFIGFVRENKLSIAEGLSRYAAWLGKAHGGKRYSPSTINRKISAAKNRVRYAFRHSAFADSLRKKHRLEDVLKAVKLKKMDPKAEPAAKALTMDEVKALVSGAKDATIRLMVAFLCGTGVRVSEMLGIKLSDMSAGKNGFREIRIRGKGPRDRIISVKKGFCERIERRFHGATYLFEHGGRSFNRVSVTNRIKHEALRAIGKEITAQQLRHTWATIQIQRGRDVKAVAAVLGHSNPGITLRMYPDKKLRPEEAFLDLESKKRGKA